MAIDLSSFKPSSRGGPALEQLKVPKPAPAPTPAPVPQPTPQTPPPANNDQIFTGPTWRKVLDVPMSLGYGIAGYTKGVIESRKSGGSYLDSIKSGLSQVIPGIKNRQDFSKMNLAGELGVKNKTAQTALNLGADLITPSVPFGKVASVGGKILNKIPFVSKLTSKVANVATDVANVARETPAVYKAIEKVNPFFRNPEIGTIVKKAEQSSVTRVNDLFNKVQEWTKGLSPEEQVEIGKVLEGGITENPKLMQIAQEVKTFTEQVGDELVQNKLLPKKKLIKDYMTHIFTNPEAPKFRPSNVRNLVENISGKFFKKRKGKEGYVGEFGPAVFKGLGTEIKDIEKSKVFKEVVEKYGQKFKKGSVIPEGMIKANTQFYQPGIKKIMKGIYLPQSVIENLKAGVEVSAKSGWDKVIDQWKAVKTIYNPAYHGANLVSNQILSDMSTGRGLIRTVKEYVDSVKSYKKASGPFYQAAERAGLINNKTFSGAFNELLDGAELVEKTKGGKVLEFARKLQQSTEETSKLNVFKSWVEDLGKKAGISAEEALKNPEIVGKATEEANKAIFSPGQISAAEKAFASKLVPFYSFTRQIIPQTTKTILNKPGRLTKYPKIFSASEQAAGGKEERPKNKQQLVKLPFKNKEGRSVYLDPTRLLPFANIYTPGFERGQLPGGLSIRPDLQELYSQAANYDPFYQRKISQEKGIKQVPDRVAHLLRTASPTVLVNIFDKVIPAWRGKKDSAGRTRNKMQAIIDSVLGIKTQSAYPKDLEFESRREKVYEEEDRKRLEGDKRLRSLQ